MRVALDLSAGVLLGFAAYAWVVYAGAVAMGHRALAHVIASSGYIVAVEIVALTSVPIPSWRAWLLLASNALGIVAMLSLAQRFK